MLKKFRGLSRGKAVVINENDMINKFEAALNRNYKKLIEAAKQKPYAYKAAFKDLDKELKQKRAIARKELTIELRNSRIRLKILQNRIDNAENIARRETESYSKEVRSMWARRLVSARRRLRELKAQYREVSAGIGHALTAHNRINTNHDGWPPIQAPSIEPSKDGAGLPDISGIYFFWADQTVEYVGRSQSIHNRVRFGHHALKAHHRISYVPIEHRMIAWAECYYIGLLRPQLNFGRNAPHYDATSDSDV